jgi:hypothetical protein
MIAGKDWDRVADVLGVQVAIKKPAKILYGVVAHGAALSSKDGRIYRIAKYQTGKGRYSYRCGCDQNVLTRRICKHIASFIVLERSVK